MQSALLRDTCVLRQSLLAVIQIESDLGQPGMFFLCTQVEGLALRWYCGGKRGLIPWKASYPNRFIEKPQVDETYTK